MKKILITGANGLLGQKLVSLLQKQGDSFLLATARSSPIPNLSQGEFHLLDITNPQQVLQVISTLQPDVVINTAAMTQVDQCETDQSVCWLSNVTAVQYLIEACEKYGIHFIHLSTDFIFRGDKGPLDELEPPSPVNFYGESKLAAEEIVKKSRIPWTIIRTVLVYGITPDLSRSNIVLWVKKSLEEGKTIRVVNDQWRTPTLVEDLAMGCYLAAQNKKEGIFHIAGKDFLTPYDMAIQTATFFNLDKSLIQITDSNHFKQPAKRPLKTGFLIDKAIKELNYKPHSFQEGLEIMKAQIQHLKML